MINSVNVFRYGKLWCGLTVFCILVSACSAQPVVKEIDRFMGKCFEYRLFCGTAVVADQGRIVYQKSFGPAVREWDIPNSPETKFKLGSVTKQFTAMLILQLVEQGKLRLDDRVSDILSDYPRDKGERITLHHLLCHSGGIPNLARQYPNWIPELWMKDYTTESFIALFKDLELEFEPGTRFAYSNAGYYLLATIIEKVTKKTFGQVLRDMIFSPLGMNGSGHGDGFSIQPQMASGYEYWNFEFMKTGYNSHTTHKGNGGMFSTAVDLFKWSRALDEAQLLSPEYQDLMFHPHISLSGGRSYAYGWVKGKLYPPGKPAGVLYMEHSGSDLGFNNLILRIPERKITLILLSNMAQTRINLIRDGLVDILYGETPFIAEPVSLALNRCRSRRELEMVFEDYRSSRDRFLIRRDAVNGVGFKFIREEKAELGLRVLEFNVQEFPDTAWSYESLSEAYLKTGRDEQALRSLQKLLELDPGNRWAEKKLKEIEERRKEP